MLHSSHVNKLGHNPQLCPRTISKYHEPFLPVNSLSSLVLFQMRAEERKPYWPLLKRHKDFTNLSLRDQLINAASAVAPLPPKPKICSVQHQWTQARHPETNQSGGNHGRQQNHPGFTTSSKTHGCPCLGPASKTVDNPKPPQDGCEMLWGCGSHLHQLPYPPVSDDETLDWLATTGLRV